ncbi:hypothetical protein HC891_15170, partial [Candidatus Gracilibacteria bacterium]|nr:hypothetical protein [Candidatus Gracilibacteria bacterium]
MHIIATMRVDYNDQLYNWPQLYDVAKQGVDLRAMTVEELRLAINAPLVVQQQQHAALKPKRLEYALVEYLANETAQRADWLPLLQSSLDDLWRRGTLTKGELGDLAQALSTRADTVVDYQLVDGQRIPRSAAARASILGIFLDLLYRAPNEQRLVRRRVEKSTLLRGDAEEVLRRRDALKELRDARLLSIVEEQVEGHKVTFVEIIHESLIANWPRLNARVDENIEVLRQRGLFSVALAAFEQNSQRLLDEAALQDFALLERRDDIVLHEESARELLAKSRKYIHDRKRSQRRSFLFGLISLALLVVAVLVGVFASQATSARERAEASNIALQALDIQTESPSLALALAYEAATRSESPITERALRTTLFQPRVQADLSAQYGYVESAEFSPDGRYVVTAGDDGTARVFAFDTTPVITVTDESGFIHSAVFNPASDEILTASADGIARRWSIGGRLLQEYSGHRASLWYAGFDRSGQHIVTASSDDSAILWTLDGEQVQRFFHQDDVRRASFHPDGQHILTASFDKTAVLWNMLDGSAVLTFTHEAHVNAAHAQPAHPRGAIVTVAHFDGDADFDEALIWAADGTFHRLDHEGDSVWDAGFSPDGLLIVTTTAQGRVRLWNIEGILLRVFTASSRDARTPAMAFSADGSWLLTAGDGVAKRWDVAKLRDSNQAQEMPVHSYEGHRGDVNAIAYNHSADRIATAGQDGIVRVWNTQGVLEKEFKAHSSTIWHIVYDASGRMLTSSADKTAKLWDAEGELLATLSGHDATVRRAAFDTTDKDQILTASWDNTARLWQVITSTKTATTVMSYTAHTEDVNSAVFSPDGEQVLTASGDKTWGLFERISGTRTLTATGHSSNVHMATFDNKGQRVLTASADGTARVWDTEGNEFTNLGVINDADGRRSASIEVALFGPNNTILTAGHDALTKVWDRSGALLYILGEHRDSVMTAAFKPGDSRYVITGSRDGSA